jgi:hypothetical protein
MRLFLMVVVFCGFMSCDFFESKDIKTQKLVEKELREIDFNDVDDYPLFDDCDETATKEQQKSCFEDRLTSHLAMALQAIEFATDSEINDTIFLDFIIENDGNVSVLNIENKEVLKGQMSEFEEKLIKSLNSLPRLEPALKRGVPVRAKFRIPIALNSSSSSSSSSKK